MASLRKEAIKGMSWTAIDRFGTKVIRIIIAMVIARILVPEDYGIIGMLAIFMALSQVVLDSGFGNALIQKKDRTNTDYCTAFYFNVVVGLVLYGILFVSAPLIARFYNTPLLTPVTRVYSLTLLIDSLNIVQTAKMRIELKFNVLSTISLTTQLVTGVVGIYLAYNGWGVWALVYQALFSCLFRCALLWWRAHWWPSLVFSWDSFRHLFNFGSKLLLSGTIHTIYTNLYTLTIGKVYSPYEVGIYNQANHFAMIPSGLASSTIVTVNYPILSRLQDDNAKLLVAYRKMLVSPLFLLYPLLMGVAALGEPLVQSLIGDQWLPIVPYMRVLCLAAMVSPLTTINLNLLYVKGRTDLVLKLDLIKKPIGIAVIFATMWFGLMPMVIGKAVFECIALAFNCYYTHKVLNYGLMKQLREILPTAFRSLVMGIVCYGAALLVDGDLPKLLVGTLMGIITYALLAYVMKDPTLAELLPLIKKRLTRKNSVES